MGQRGLRTPQLGAVHSVLGSWTTGASQPGTVVMPTGTGKTETMVALLSVAAAERLVVVVPSDALRGQISRKFETLGVLQAFGVIASSALRPVVGQVQHAFLSAASAVEFARQCNVLVTTPNALFASDPAVTAALLECCSHLFVDEAHHVEAPTWKRIRDAFADKPVLQFTATPFREDGRRLGGRIVYEFPLREAQRLGYFSEIDYTSVLDFENPDAAIAHKAVARLRQDLDAGLDHLLMARVRRIGRAQDVREVYSQMAGDLEPVILHSTLPVGDQRTALDAIRERRSRIIVCVNMLGEGFDLPSLKVAAIHDAHRSLGVTLQFVGRFARVAGSDIGRASVFVGRPQPGYDESLRKLFAENADWNQIIRDLSESQISEQRELDDFEAAFGPTADEVSIRSLAPKMSTVVYRTTCREWAPQAVLRVHPEDQLLTFPFSINEDRHVLWFITEERTPVRWADLAAVEEIVFHLYVVYWDRQRQLLYINSSDTDSHYEELAKAICGTNVDRIRGEAVYRAMADIKRLVPTNVGVLDVRNRSRRFSMHVGADVIEGFPTAEAQTKTKTNIFAFGFERGARVSVGASLKGRVWSYRVAHSLKEWVDWCDHVGGKLSNDEISIDAVMRGFIRPVTLEERPALVPLAIEWPWEPFASLTEELRVIHQDGSWPLVDVDLRLTSFSDTGPIAFEVRTDEWSVPYTADFSEGRLTFRARADEVHVGTRRSGPMPLSAYFDKTAPVLLFEKDAVVVSPGVLLQPDRERPPFDTEKLEVIDWSGIDLRKESQGQTRDAASIQARAIEHVLADDGWDVVIDDDGSGEVADIVALRIDDEYLDIHLTHCKYALGGKPGARVADLYEVCGQAQKSVHWRHHPDLLFGHLIRREQRRLRMGRRSGFERGTGSDLYGLEELARTLRPRLSVTIAQPGLSRSRVSSSQLELLATTEVYLAETAGARLGVLCHA